MYKVDGDLYPRKELQLVKGHVIKPAVKPAQAQAILAQQNKVGMAANNPIVKQLMNTTTPNYQAVATMLQSGRSKRPKKIKGASNYTQLSGITTRPKKV